MNKTISIILPVYNSARTLNRCLDSILSQTYSKFEVICVDDASLDNSLSILQEYQRKDVRIKVYGHDQNRNAGGARNTALSHAIGDYVYFMDSDDYLKSNALQTLVNNSDGFSTDIVLAPLTVVNNDKVLALEKTASTNLSVDEYKFYCLHNGLRISGGVFKRCLFVNHNIQYPENVCFEDNAIGGLLFYMLVL